MKKFLILAVCAFFTAAPAFGALSPLNQSIKELQAILSSNEVASLPQGEPIRKIYHRQNSYYVKTKSKDLAVDVIYSQNQKVGPKEFTLQFHPLEEAEDD